MRKKIISILLLIFFCLIFAGCDNKKIVAKNFDNTQVVWKNANEKVVDEKIYVKKVNFANVLTIKNLIVEIKKQISKNNIIFNLITKNMQVKFNKNSVEKVNALLSFLDKSGSLKINHLEDALSNIALKINMNLQNDSLKCDFNVLNIKNMFNKNKDKNLTKTLKLDNKNAILKNFKTQMSSHIISNFKLLTEKNKETLVFDFDNINNFVFVLLTQFGNNVVFDNISLNELVFKIFGNNFDNNTLNNIFKVNSEKYDIDLSSFSDNQYINQFDGNFNITCNLKNNQVNTILQSIFSNRLNKLQSNICNIAKLFLSNNDCFFECDFEISSSSKIIS